LVYRDGGMDCRRTTAQVRRQYRQALRECVDHERTPLTLTLSHGERGLALLP
jgi:hypothetical protein